MADKNGFGDARMSLFLEGQYRYTQNLDADKIRIFDCQAPNEESTCKQSRFIMMHALATSSLPYTLSIFTFF